MRAFVRSHPFWVALVIPVLLLWAGDCLAVGFRTEVPVGAGKTLPLYVYLPQQPAKYRLPGVIVAAGVGATKIVQFHEYCRLLADRGFIVVFMDPSNYPESMTPGPLDWDRGGGNFFGSLNQGIVGAKLIFDRKSYLASFRAAVDYLCFHPAADPTRIALSGFSQPANAILEYACIDPRIKALVWNYGGWPWIFPYQPAQLPPVLIFHGEDDDIYDVKYARQLAEELRLSMRYHEVAIYPGRNHMFNIYYDLSKENRYMKPALLDAFERLVSFLNRVMAVQVR